ncbi:hypothetical protein AXF42_Ash003578 [Apostasia shenzhenica]|uniref:Protein LNK3 n=1 Tax=Apostasia shenzhenica TaxID=1088818 RepID=A0A2I0BGL4_9ASPA|nr:hypothetical protein AXF42_Ash003578 [Apostasia shenzhenica]
MTEEWFFIFQIQWMDCYNMQVNSDFVVPSNDHGVFWDTQTYTNDWFQWDGDDLNMMKSNSRSLYDEEMKDHQLRLHKGCCGSNACENAFLLDCRMRTADVMFDDLRDIQLQNSMEFTDDIFLNPLMESNLTDADNLSQKKTDADNANKSSCMSGSMHIPLASENLPTCKLADSKNPMIDPSIIVNADPNFRSYNSFESSPISEGAKLTVVNESLKRQAMVLEFENVMMQLSSEIRICIRDALYRLADSSEDQHKGNQDDYGKTMDRASISELNGENFRQIAWRTEPKTNVVVDRAIAVLLFSRRADIFEELPDSQLFCKSKQNAEASVI